MNVDPQVSFKKEATTGSSSTGYGSATGSRGPSTASTRTVVGHLPHRIQRLPAELRPSRTVYCPTQEVHILPFSFTEYRKHFGGEEHIDDGCDDYIRRDGLAGSYAYADISELYGYIRDVCRTILTRDLVQKFSLPDTQVLERLAEYMMDNSGNLNSPNSIANVLDVNKVSHQPRRRWRVYVPPARRLRVLRSKALQYKGKKYLVP